MFRRDAVKALKQSIRDLEDEVPRINEALALLKAQVTLAETDLARSQAKERELVEKVAAAVRDDRHDIALNYASVLAEVRGEVERHAREHEAASGAFRQAQRHKREFMADRERRIQEAKDVLAAQRAAEWNERVAQALHLLARSRRPAAADRDLAERVRARADESQALLARALEELGETPDLDPALVGVFLAALKRQVESLEEGLARTRRQVEALEGRLAGPI